MPQRPPSSHAAAGISRDDIAAAALAILRGGRIEDVTMRAVADRLGVRAPSLYHHVSDKAELLALVARYSMQELAPSVDAFEQVRTLDEWFDTTTSESLTLRAFYLRHPGIAAVMLSQASADRFDGEGTRAALVRAETEALVRLGVPADEARHCYEVAARWAVAYIIAESLPHPHPELDEMRFRDGLALLQTGLRHRLEPLIPRTTGRAELTRADSLRDRDSQP